MITSEALFINRLHLWNFSCNLGCTFGDHKTTCCNTALSWKLVISFRDSVLNFTQQRREIRLRLNWKRCCTDVTLISCWSTKKKSSSAYLINLTCPSFLFISVLLGCMACPSYDSTSCKFTRSLWHHDLPFMSWLMRLFLPDINCLQLPDGNTKIRATFYTGWWVSVDKILIYSCHNGEIFGVAAAKWIAV